jgi:hypothetical protein
MSHPPNHAANRGKTGMIEASLPASPARTPDLQVEKHHHIASATRPLRRAGRPSPGQRAPAGRIRGLPTGLASSPGRCRFWRRRSAGRGFRARSSSDFNPRGEKDPRVEYRPREHMRPRAHVQSRPGGFDPQPGARGSRPPKPAIYPAAAPLGRSTSQFHRFPIPKFFPETLGGRAHD